MKLIDMRLSGTDCIHNYHTTLQLNNKDTRILISNFAVTICSRHTDSSHLLQQWWYIPVYWKFAFRYQVLVAL